MRDAVREAVGIEARHGGGGQHVARAAIEDDDRSALRAEAPSGKLLKPRVDGEAHGIAGHIGPCLQVADDTATRRHFRPARARLAGELLVERLFEPILARLIARRDEQRVLGLLIILGRRRADIADQVTDGRAGRVEARVALGGRDAGQVGKANGDRRKLFVGQVIGDLHRLEAGGLVEILVDAVDVVGIELEKGGQLLHHPVAVLQSVLDDVDAKVGAIAGQRLAAPVDQPAAAWRDDGQVDPVALREQPVFLVFGNGDPAHAADKQAAHGQLSASKEERPTIKREGLAGFRHQLLWLPGPLVQNLHGRRHLSSAAHTRTTSGNRPML